MLEGWRYTTYPSASPRLWHCCPCRIVARGLEYRNDEAHTLHAIPNPRHEQALRIGLALLLMGNDLVGEIFVQLREGFQVSFRMAAGNPCCMGGGRPSSCAAASNTSPRLTQRQKDQFVGIFLPPLEASLLP